MDVIVFRRPVLWLVVNPAEYWAFAAGVRIEGHAPLIAVGRRRCSRRGAFDANPIPRRNRNLVGCVVARGVGIRNGAGECGVRPVLPQREYPGFTVTGRCGELDIKIPDNSGSGYQLLRRGFRVRPRIPHLELVEFRIGVVRRGIFAAGNDARPACPGELDAPGRIPA